MRHWRSPEPGLAGHLCRSLEPKQAPEFLKELFSVGADLLLDYLELVWAGMAAKTAVAQDGSQASTGAGPCGMHL